VDGLIAIGRLMMITTLSEQKKQEPYINLATKVDEIEDLARIFVETFANQGITPQFDDRAGVGIERLFQVFREVFSANMCIFDISSEEKEQYIELGIALALNKRMIILARKDSSVPSRLASNNVIRYSDTKELRGRLEGALGQGLLDEVQKAAPHCQFCEKACPGMGALQYRNRVLVLDNRRVLWMGLMEVLESYLDKLDVNMLRLTDAPIDPPLCDLRGKIRESQFAISHLGNLSNADTMLALGMVIGLRVPRVILSRASQDELPSILAGVDFGMAYEDMDELRQTRLDDLRSRFLDVILPSFDRLRPTNALKFSWDRFNNLADSLRSESVSRSQKDIQGRLRVLRYQGDHIIRIHTLYTQSILFGRDQTKCDVHLPSIAASREHFIIWKGRENNFYVEDLESTIPPVLNGHPLVRGETREIFFGDSLRVGQFEFKIWDNRHLPMDSIIQTRIPTADLKEGHFRIHCPDVQRPSSLVGVDHKYLLRVRYLDKRLRTVTLEVQGYYPLGKILERLIVHLGLPQIRHHFMIQDEVIEDSATPYDLNIGDSEFLLLVENRIDRAILDAQSRIKYCERCQPKMYGEVEWRFGKKLGTLREIFEGIYYEHNEATPPDDVDFPLGECPNCGHRVTASTMIGGDE
jgi:hypothetical protein